MYNMNHKQREHVNDELHCVQTRYESNNIVETPQLIRLSLIEMNTIIENDSIIPRKKKQAHIYATTTLCNCHTNTNTNTKQEGSSNCCKCYVRSNHFRIRFLRTDLFNPHKAAIRYCKNLNLICRYFGDVSLQRQLYLTDLTRDEIKFMKQGEKQVLSCRDKLGRRIYWTLGMISNIRIDLYILDGMAEDILTQQNGAICIMMFNGSEQSLSQVKLIQLVSQSNNSNSNSNSNNSTSASNDDVSSDDCDVPIAEDEAFSSSSSTKLSNSSQTTTAATHPPPAQILQEGNQNVYQEMFEASPLYSAGTHICFPVSNKYHLYKAIVMAMFGSEFRMATRIHNGSPLECIYELSNYGIDIHDIPLTHTGTIKTERSAAFVKTRKSIDSFRKQQVIKQQNQQQQQQQLQLQLQLQLQQQHQHQHQQLQQQQTYHLNPSSSSSSSSNAVTLGNNTIYDTARSSFNRKTTGRKKNNTDNNNNNKNNSSNNNSTVQFVSDDPPGMECPGQNYVICGFKRAYNYPANIMFREQVRIKLLEAESKYDIHDHSAPASSCSSYAIHLDSIVYELLNQFKLCEYDKIYCWYVPITDRTELRKKVRQAIRDERKRFIRQKKFLQMQNGTNSSSENGASTGTTTTKHQSTVSLSSTTATTKRSINSRGGVGGGKFSFSSYNDNNHDVFEDSSMMGVDAKRLKKAYGVKQRNNNNGNGHGNNNNSNNNNDDDGSSSSSLFACWDVGGGSGCI
jgi:hypothetical protein